MKSNSFRMLTLTVMVLLLGTSMDIQAGRRSHRSENYFIGLSPGNLSLGYAKSKGHHGGYGFSINLPLHFGSYNHDSYYRETWYAPAYRPPHRASYSRHYYPRSNWTYASDRYYRSPAPRTYVTNNYYTAVEPVDYYDYNTVNYVEPYYREVRYADPYCGGYSW